jgi:hydroxymethylbilane synthase
VSANAPARRVPDGVRRDGERPLRIGTRSSALALAQARAVAAAIGASRPVELVTSTDGPAGGVEDKSRWVSVIEAALLDERIDLAVHSAKDLPVELPDGLALIGAPVRADARDTLCGAPSLAALRPGARVGTSSLRRAAQLRALRSDFEICECRGNVDTRLRKLAAGEFDAIVIAAAGLQRLGLDRGAPLDELVPAPGQGTIALEARAGDHGALAAIKALRDAQAEAELAAERAVVGALGAGCHTPLGVHARIVDGRLTLHAFVGLPDGSAWIRDELRHELREPTVSPASTGSTGATGSSASTGSTGSTDSTGSTGPGEELGRELARRLLSAGAAEMLG